MAKLSSGWVIQCVVYIVSRSLSPEQTFPLHSVCCSSVIGAESVAEKNERGRERERESESVEAATNTERWIKKYTVEIEWRMNTIRYFLCVMIASTLLTLFNFAFNELNPVVYVCECIFRRFEHSGQFDSTSFLFADYLHFSISNCW